MAANSTPPGYWSSPWPGEDAGPSRSQAPHGTAGPGVRPGERLEVTWREAFATTMIVLRDPGEVFALRHTLRGLRHPSTGWVERIDPHTLQTIERSSDLDAGPFWPGGMAAHANGSLYTVFGRWCHRLDADCSVTAKRELPQPRPYNSFLILPDGTLVMKDLDLQQTTPARLTLLDPDTLEPRAAELQVPEPVVARLSADGNILYVVGVSTVYRYVWDSDRQALEPDDGWRFQYRTRTDQSYGWDPVIEGAQVWFLDNGDHTYTTSMLGAGVATGPVHLIRISTTDAADRDLIEVSGDPRGAVTDPPLYDPRRRIALGYDSANAALAAWRLEDDDHTLAPLWRKTYATASHLIRYPDTGEVVIGDFHDGLPRLRHSALRRLARRSGAVVANDRLRAAATKRSHDDIVVIDIETGEEHARGQVPSAFQSVVFPAAGFERDLYYCTMSTIARASVVSTSTPQTLDWMAGAR